MAAKPFWRRISVWHVNAVVIALILVLGVAYRTELRWAARELPRYLHGEIGTPAETRMYNAAARLVYANERLELAESFLFIVKGSARVSLDGEFHDVKAGDFIYVPEKVFHGFETIDEACEFYSIQSPPIYPVGEPADIVFANNEESAE